MITNPNAMRVERVLERGRLRGCMAIGQPRFDNIDMLSIYMAERMSHLHKLKSPGRLYHRVIQISLLARVSTIQVRNPEVIFGSFLLTENSASSDKIYI